jgi:hypothetical protein
MLGESADAAVSAVKRRRVIMTGLFLQSLRQMSGFPDEA